MNKAIIAILAILTIGLAGCTLSSNSPDGSNVDELSPAEGSVSIDSGLWSDGDEEADYGDVDSSLEDDDGEDEDAADEEAEDTADTEEEEDAIDMGCGFPIHHIEIGESDFSFEIDQPAPEIEITVTGGSGNFNLYPSVTDATLPSGMYFEDGETGGVIAGTPHEEGAFDVTIKVKDIICEETVTEQFTITVFAPFEPPSVIFEPTEPGNPDLLVKKEPIVAVRVDGDFTNGDGIVFLKNNEIVDIKTFRGFVPLTFEVSESLDQELEDVEGRYTIDVYRMTPDPFLPTVPHIVVPNFTLLPVFPTSFFIMPVLHQIVVTDTWRGDAQYVYYLNVKTQCRTARLRDMHIRFKAIPKEKTQKGYCYSGGDYHVTWAGLALSNDSHKITTTDSKNHWLRKGIFRKKYKLTTEANDNKIKDRPKILNWDWSNVQDGAKGVQCLEDVTMFGVWFKEGGCAGSKPDYHIKAVEVKACENASKLKKSEQFSDGCFYANFEGKVGWNNVGNYGERKGNYDFDKVDGRIWHEERDSSVAELFEDLGEDY